MPRPKPPGWPAYMIAKRLKSGVRYYWNLPKWAVTAGCTMEREPLGLDYGEAKRRCDEILNPQFQAWLKRGEISETSPRLIVGTFDWLVAQYKTSPRFRNLPLKTQKNYDASLRLVADFGLKDGRRFGGWPCQAFSRKWPTDSTRNCC
jgi:hypothetical protein